MLSRIARFVSLRLLGAALSLVLFMAAPASADAGFRPEAVARYPILGKWKGFAPGRAADRLRVAVALFHYPDKPLQATKDEIFDALFGAEGSVADLYQEASFGRVSFEPAYLGTFTLPFSASKNCVPVFDPFTRPEVDSEEHILAAAATAMEQGVDFSAYDRVIFFVPDYGEYCKRTSVGLSLGEGKGLVLIYGSEHAPPFPPSSVNRRLLVHEIGHPFPLGHGVDASGDYGDRSCAMGGVHRRTRSGFVPLPMVHFCAAHKYQLGWLAPNQVIDVTKSGIYRLGAVSNPGSLPVTLRFPTRYFGRHYFVSLRIPVGYDSNLEPQFRNRIQVHSYADSLAPVNDIEVRDAVFLHSSLRRGEAYVDSLNDVKIKFVSLNGTSAAVRITLERAKDRTGEVASAPE